MSEVKTDIKFKPIRGLEADLMNLAHTEGALLIATDSGKMWMDTPKNRVSLGGSGASLLYASANVTELADLDGNYYYAIDKNELDNSEIKPQIDDLILNSDGSFYRITEIEDEDTLLCSRLAVSGTGGGGGGTVSGSKAMTIKGYSLDTVTLVNGQRMEASFKATSALDENGEVYDDELTISWSLYVTSTGVIYDSGTFKVNSGEETTFEFGTRLRDSTGTTLAIYATGVNSGKSRTITWEVTTVELLLYESEKFKNVSAQSSSNLVLYCNVSGNIEKILDFYIDGNLVGTKTLGKSASGEQSLQVTGITHGSHEVLINLSQSIDGERGTSVNEPLEFEIAVYDGSSTDPIIWIGDYEDEYYNYDAIKIPYRVYNPAADTTEVTFVKGITELETRTESSGATSFSIWQITDAEQDIINTYTIRATKSIVADDTDSKYVSRDINFSVIQDPNRDLSLTNSERLMLKFDAAGRSNSVSETARQTWTYNDTINSRTYSAKFDNFNWYNNGWKLDENNDSMLRISNGASFSIPIGNMVLNNSAQSNNQSRTFEFEFKVRNVQDYSNLIKEYTRYSGDETYWTAFVAQMNNDNGQKNYDNFLRTYLVENDTGVDYDKATESFAGITRMVQGDNAFCTYRDSNGRGFALGPQDGFFATANTTLNVKYVEDQLINLSIVFNYDDKRIYMYLQGVLTAVAAIPDTTAVEINSDSIVFNSNYCDIDLYKFRVYTNALSVRDILINYAVDHASVLDYDHTTQLLSYNQDTGEYQLDYSSVEAWNADSDHLDNLLMPYVIFETPAGTKLPYSKADKKVVGFTYVNPALDRMYQNGELEEEAEKMTDIQKAAATKEGLTYAQYYYKHHCPSFTSIEMMVNLAVQGTSSEFYPRRNYKAKTKGSDDNIYMYMNQGPFKELYAAGIAGDAEALEKCHLDFFYYNNYSVGTTKFTMKIDYMESSGTYNMGLANLVHSAYTKHPVDDYNTAGAFNKVSYSLASEVTAESGVTYYEDSKGSTKVTFTEEKPYVANTYYKPVYTAYTFDETTDFRTNVQGFPVMGFWLCSGAYQFIGRYNMLLDKGSDEVYAFKPSKSITQSFSKNKTVRKIAECWEYSDNARGFCSFRDPLNRHKLNFDVYTRDSDGNKVRTYNAKSSCPVVADSYEYRYNTNEDFLDYAYDPKSNSGLYNDLIKDTDHPNGDYDADTLTSGSDKMATEMLKIYANWEKANQWVWSTCLDNVPTEAERLAGAAARKIMNYVSAAGETYDNSVTYYDENEDEITDISIYLEENGTTLNSNVYIGEPYIVTYSDVEYEYDTKEYRKAKFINELTAHFDLEYCLVYFIITEVLMCYDSRGKNCMMASWGPKTAGGDYIWYPVFYDMDTQLGINNTGIPSFDYSENATVDGTFSTSDSILWNNLFECFRTQIVGKYIELRNSITSGRNIGKGTLYDVDHIEKWYLADPDETGEIEMRGDRPLAMFNMDEFFKYLSITNTKIGYQNQSGGTSVDTSNQYFYALQGDRSLSRQQFLARRLNFIDSWFSTGDYGRGQGSYIWARVGANNPSSFSDKWIADESQLIEGFEYAPYYVTDDLGNTVYNADGSPKKTNYLDADFFINLTPYQKSYVTIGNDNESFDSKEYEDKPVRYEFPSTNITGIMNSPNLKESLFYVYGSRSLSDIGDISRLYLSEFKVPEAPHILRLLIGNDHPDFFNNVLGSIEFDASSSSIYGKPLLKEVNLTGIQFTSAVNATFDFTSSEKMTIFKALRSNVESVTFADGVALHTLYLPNTVSTLALTEAENLTNVINNLDFTGYDEDQLVSTYYSKYDEANDIWTVEKGLYIEGLTNLDASTLGASSTCNISTINITGGNLGYGSYDILYKLYLIYRYGLGNNAAATSTGQSELKISLTDVDWSPYKKLDADAVRNSEASYYTDDGHYGFTPYTYSTEAQWAIDLANGEIYIYDEADVDNISKIKDIDMLFDFIDRGQFKNVISTGNSVPVITGSIYVDNDNPIDENQIRNRLLLSGNFDETKLDIHFKNVNKGYKAKFIQLETDGTYQVIGTQVLAADNITTQYRFTSPYTLYEATRDNYDFHGWSTNNTDGSIIEENSWATSEATMITEGKYDYTFYAMFTRHEFIMNFMVGTTTTGFTSFEQIGVLYGDLITPPSAMPVLNESNLDTEERYKFLGWTQDRTAVIAKNASSAKIVNVSRMYASADMTFYAVFLLESVYDSTIDEKYLKFNLVSNESIDDSLALGTMYGYELGLNKYNESSNPNGYDPSDISGKITLPTYYQGLPIVRIRDFENCSNLTHIFFEHNNALGDCQVKVFGTNAFLNCSNLEYLEIPDSLLVIGDYALANTYKLTNTVLGTNVKLIRSQGVARWGGGNQTPAYNSDIRDFYLPGSLRYIAENGFINMYFRINTLYIGSSTEPTQLANWGAYNYNYNNYILMQEGLVEQVVIYYANESDKSIIENLISTGRFNFQTNNISWIQATVTS